MDKPILATISGGRSSAFMCKFIKEHFADKGREVLFIFANTGKELEATLEFIEECDNRWGLGVVWVEAKINPEKGVGTSYKVVDFDTASRNGEPFEAMLEKYGLPNRQFPHCTRELKLRPMRKYAKDILGPDYVTAMGIRTDERHRISTKGEFDLIYPLDQLNITNDFIRRWWDMQDFDLDLDDYQGNCDFCFKKSMRKKMTIAKESPKKLEWWESMEKKYGNGYLFEQQHGGLSVSTILGRANTVKFTPHTDYLKHIKQSPSLFTQELDSEIGCFCTLT
jgi:hypothetical protein